MPGCSAFHLRCSRLLSASSFILFTATSPLCHLCMSGRGAAPPCISLFDLFPMASIAFHFGLHGFDASAFTFVRTSYRLLGWVTFVHHSVKQHVRRLPALGYDSLEYFIFYIPSEYIGFGQIVWPILHTFTFWILNFTEAREHPHTDPGQTPWYGWTTLRFIARYLVLPEIVPVVNKPSRKPPQRS